jgi:hypothetical protein
VTPAGDHEEQGSLALSDEARTARQPHPLRPAEAAAAVLLGRALDADRAATANLVNDEAITVIEVSSPDLVELVNYLLVHHLIGSDRTLEGDGAPGDWPVTPGSVTVFSRDGSNERRNRKSGNENFAAAVQRGCAVIGISADPFRLLPSDLTAFATQRIILPRLDADSVAAIIEAVTGKRPARAISAAAVRGGIRHLRLAVRADLGPARSLSRLERLAEMSSAPDGTPLLSQLHGLGEAQTWGLSLIEDLRDLGEGRIAASDLPRGILLWGRPGTGKTLFARSLSKEAGVFFRATSYGEWQSHRDGHLGSVIQAIRNVFAEVAANAPGILFIDEIDSLPARGSTLRHDDWWTAITNVLLEELDSVDPRRRQGIIVMAACNNVLRLDPALTRAGRLDKVVHIPLPDAAALAAIIRTHLGEHFGADALLSAAAEARGSTGADVETWARGVRRRARRADRAPTVDDLLSEIRSGRLVLTDMQRRRMAYHESGHAIVARCLDGECPMSLSIVDAGGGLASFDTAHLRLLTLPRLENLIARILAGRAAEELACGGMSDGGGDDIALATKLAISVECTLGLGSLGPLSLGENPPITAVLAIPEAASSVRKLLSDGHRRAVQVLQKNRALLDRLATELLDRGFLEAAEIARIVSPAAQILRQGDVGDDIGGTGPSEPLL